MGIVYIPWRETSSCNYHPNRIWPWHTRMQVVTIFHYERAVVDCVWNVMAHAQKPDFVFRRNVRVHLNRRGRQFSRLLAAEVCASAVVMLDTPCTEVVWRVLATHSIRQFPCHFPSHASPCAINFQLDSNKFMLRLLLPYLLHLSPCNYLQFLFHTKTLVEIFT
jgi:hypothetical protein